jgi:hypothetical protein
MRVRATGSEISGDRPWAHRSSPTSWRRSSRLRTAPRCRIGWGLIVGRGEGHLPLRSGGPGWARVQPLDLVHRLPLSRARRDITRIEVYECIQRRTIVGEWVRMRRI